MPYFVRRCAQPDGESVFVAVFEGCAADHQVVRGVTRLPLPADAPADAVALTIATREGIDVIVSMISPKRMTVDGPAGEVTTDGRLAIVLARGNEAAAACLVAGTVLAAPGVTLRSPRAAYSGDVIEAVSEADDSYFLVRGDLPEPAGLSNATLFVTGKDAIRRAYPIRRVRRADGATRIYTKVNNVGFEARPARTWEIPSTSTWRK